MIRSPFETLAEEVARALLSVGRPRARVELEAPHLAAGGAARIAAALANHLTPSRKARLDRAVELRCYGTVPVVEGLANLGNVSAVMRSAEALGYLGFGIITGPVTKVKVSDRTSTGAERWLDVWRWNDAAEAVPALRRAGYRILATAPDGGEPIEAVDFTRPAALVFGNEEEGISSGLLASADGCCTIPMDGLTRSLNISVAAALALYQARSDRLRRRGRHGDLDEEWKETWRAIYYLRSVPGAGAILARLLL